MCLQIHCYSRWSNCIRRIHTHTRFNSINHLVECSNRRNSLWIGKEYNTYHKASGQYRSNVCVDHSIQIISNANPKLQCTLWPFIVKDNEWTQCTSELQILASVVFQKDNEWNDVRRRKIIHILNTHWLFCLWHTIQH